jgi:hypothetical protein
MIQSYSVYIYIYNIHTIALYHWRSTTGMRSFKTVSASQDSIRKYEDMKFLKMHVVLTDCMYIIDTYTHYSFVSLTQHNGDDTP